MFLRTLSAFINILAGAIIGLTLIEITLRLNPSLLPKGIPSLTPLDPPLMQSTYNVLYSDGDSFTWSPELIKPLSPQENQVEAHVNFETDEYGFPNHGPIPEVVDLVVLGRSYSMGAESTTSWTKLVSQITGWKIFNLSQISSGNDIKLGFLRKYGFEHHPRWIIVEVLPLMDIVGYQHADPLLVQQIPNFVLRGIFRRFLNYQETTPQNNDTAVNVRPYPLIVPIGDHTYHVVFSSHELAALTISPSEAQALKQWQLFTQDLQQLVSETHQHAACVALLYAQSKTGAYLPLLQDSSGMTVVRNTLTENGETPLLSTLQSNDEGMRTLVANYAHQHNLVFIDPTDIMRASLTEGINPFMAYDSHLSSAGHDLVAQKVVETLNKESCN